MIDVPAHVLRYWESEFPQLKPNKGSGGQRLYRQQDIELIRDIKSLLYDRGYTIEGARKTLTHGGADGPTTLQIDRAVRELRDIAKLLQPSNS